MKMKIKRFVKKYLLILLVALVVVLALLAGYFYRRATSDNSERETKMLVRKVGHHAILPTDETPTIATVSDPAALAGQDFFVGAKVGDKVLIYPQAKRAVLYDPVADRVITISPLNIEGTK